MRALTRLRSPRVVTTAPAGVLVVLLGWLILNGAVGGQVTLSKLGAISSLLVVILVTAAVGIVVAAHQPRNPIGWLLAGESAFMLLSINASAYANFVYRLGYHDLSFAGPPMLVLGQLFNFLLTGFPLLILLFPDGRLPSRRWRWALGAYLAIAATAMLATAGGVVSLVITHRVDLQASGNLANLGRGSLAWMVPVQVTFLITVAAVLADCRRLSGAELAAIHRGTAPAAQMAGQRRRRLRPFRHLGHRQ